MLSFITFTDAPEQIEIVGDDAGLLDLILYLEGVRKGKDHMHLTIDSELNPFPIGPARKDKTLFVKHARIEYAKTESWLQE